MHVLMIGGTGTISQYVVKRCLDVGIEVTVLNRGNHQDAIPTGANSLIGDINNHEQVKSLIKDQYFDTIIDFIAYTVDDVKRDVMLFRDKCNQYIFISSASAYQKPLPFYPITEDIEVVNQYWDYSQHKADAEHYLKTIKDFNYTIVRPSHTYDDQTLLVVIKKDGYPYAHIKRLIEGRPVIVPGDGTSLWTVTHASDFAYGFVDLIGNKKAYQEAFHITGDKYYTWDDLTHMMANHLGVKAHIIHIPSDIIIHYFKDLEGPLLGDKACSAVFDNAKIKRFSKHYQSAIGYDEIVGRAMNHYLNDKTLQKVDDEFEKTYDLLIEKYQTLFK